jgi:hypothetical protein
MRQAVNVAILSTMLFGGVLAAAPPTLAEEISCVGTIGARMVDNVRVPQGRSCTLEGTTVQGTVIVERDATLRARGARINGNVQAENHRFVAVTNGTRVGGAIQIDEGGVYRVANSVAEGIQVKANSGESFLRGNRVNSDIQVFNHSGGVDIANNQVGGNLQCKENAPAPTGGGNIVQGNKEDQCANL